jgi:hypothetical protein
MSTRHPNVLRGRLSDSKISAIADMGERGLSAGAIALRLNRHPGTVTVAMHRLGLRKPVRRYKAYVRASGPVYPFSPEEDCFILDRRVAGAPLRQIAAETEARFFHRRSADSIRVRLVMLASAEACA